MRRQAIRQIKSPNNNNNNNNTNNNSHHNRGVISCTPSSLLKYSVCVLIALNVAFFGGLVLFDDDEDVNYHRQSSSSLHSSQSIVKGENSHAAISTSNGSVNMIKKPMKMVGHIDDDDDQGVIQRPDGLIHTGEIPMMITQEETNPEKNDDESSVVANSKSDNTFDSRTNEKGGIQSEIGHQLNSGSDTTATSSPGPKIFTAYIEPPLEYIPMADRSNIELGKYEYPQVQGCRLSNQKGYFTLADQLPVNPPEGDDENSIPIPPDLDAFLPWLHDVFTSDDGQFVHFIGQHRRRCHVGKEDWLEQYMPQSSLFQHVPVKRIVSPKNGLDKIDEGLDVFDMSLMNVEYKLVSHDEADVDGMETRFICRFHTNIEGEEPKVYETLSVFPFDIDYVTYRKGYPATFTEAGKDVHMIWSSQLHFSCPVPVPLKALTTSTKYIDHSLYVDLIPIRTLPRFTPPAEFLPPRYNIPNKLDISTIFGAENLRVQPPVEKSGRLTNIPVCPSSIASYEDQEDENGSKSIVLSSPPKNDLVACTWASTSFKTRSNIATVNDGKRRLVEWIQHQLNVGFDHVYVFDNSGAFTLKDDLSEATDMFGPDKVSRIPWPAKICNNNLARHNDKGERSSQYAADATCRIRFGSSAKWISFIDTDEYLVPTGNYTSIKEFILNVEENEEKIKIINFYSARAKPRFELMDISESGEAMPKENSSFLEAYNCERELPPKTFWMPAEKQIYRPDYVLHHFIHYPTASTESIMSKRENNDAGLPWRQRHNEEKMGHARFVNEITEATMIHTKALTHTELGKSWEGKCKRSNCHLGFAFPEEQIKTMKKEDFSVGKMKNSDGYVYNCWPNPAGTIWAEKLHESLEALYSSNHS